MIEVSFRYMAAQKVVPLSSAGVGSARASNPNWSKAFELLRFELAKIGAKQVVIEAGYKPHQVRADGWPYSNAKPEHHHVRVSFSKDGVPISFLQNGFNCVEYNVWLIGRTLNALRAVDRYGCTKAGEQYKGWAQLPPGASGSAPIAAAEWATPFDAATFLLDTGDPNGECRVLRSEVIRGGAVLEDAFRAAAKKAHPDTGGSADLVSKVSRARDFIEQHAGAHA